MTRGKNEIENTTVIYLCMLNGFSDLEELTLRDDLRLVFCLSLVYTHAAASCVRERHRRRGKTCAAQMKLQTNWRINLV